MIAIDNVLLSDDVIQARFVCDLHKCKGGCCEDGDAGAPLEKEEKKHIDDFYETVKPYLTPESIEVVERQGKYSYDKEFGWVTPTVNGAICAYGYRDDQGVIKCAFEQAYNDGKIGWKKPISCHLFPIRLSKSREYIMANYEPRPDLCKAACSLGKKLKVPVYQFLKEPLIRKFGTDFYNALHHIAKHQLEEQK
ncbi:MAG: DUF3109 domain-containing protein [Chitinophagaceae bacterium]